MTHYLTAFSLYTLAMIGIFFIAFVVYKKTVSFGGNNSKSLLKIEDALRLAQRKTIYILRCGTKRFLIASDSDKTTLLAKLEDAAAIKDIQQAPAKDKYIDPKYKAQIEKYINEVQSIDNENQLNENSLKNLEEQLQESFNAYNEPDYDNSVYKHTKSTVMKNILKELNTKSGTKEGGY